jgi:hypothetical protein
MKKDIDAVCEFLLRPTLPKLGICPLSSNWIYPVTTELPFSDLKAEDSE